MQIQPSRIDSWKMFGRISPRYDLLNGLLSLGLDGSWRRSIGKYLPQRKDLKILDLATGTGGLLLAILSNTDNIASAVGLDMSAKMLAIAENKIAERNLQNSISLVRADAAEIPFTENSFDAVTMAFGIRNVVDVNLVLKQMYKVLKPNGKAVILEFALPENFLLKKIFLFYLRIFVPAIGAIISGDRGAYKYLNQTVETFLTRKELQLAMKDAGFSNLNVVPMTFGVACIYCGDKPA